MYENSNILLTRNASVVLTNAVPCPQMMGGGFINTIIKVAPDTATEDEAVIVRIYTQNSGKLREDLSSLVTVMRVAEAGGVGAPVLAEFNNGLVYKFTQGEMLDPDVHPHTPHIQT